jgi:hypothetical protein
LSPQSSVSPISLDPISIEFPSFSQRARDVKRSARRAVEAQIAELRRNGQERVQQLRTRLSVERGEAERTIRRNARQRFVGTLASVVATVALAVGIGSSAPDLGEVEPVEVNASYDVGLDIARSGALSEPEAASEKTVHRTHVVRPEASHQTTSAPREQTACAGGDAFDPLNGCLAP